MSWNINAKRFMEIEGVILLVRMWVEMIQGTLTSPFVTGHPPCEDVSWNVLASSLIPSANLSSSLWGCELKCPCMPAPLLVFSSSSLWGCELKYVCHLLMWFLHCHPPCEDVSWNMTPTTFWNTVEVISLWGCELKFANLQSVFYAELSSSLWGCELKYITII